ncbi:MAG: TerC family protein [Gemmatimonadetes bacterium]|nr:MAG: TerC family protein [Gemmatimonadota bacterium]
MEWITLPEAWIALATLTVLEIVLGIDNIVFISILADRLPKEQQSRARRLGLMIAMVSRILLLLSISWIMRLTAPLFSVLDHGVSGRDLILIGGGLFLLTKSTREIHHKLEGDDEHHAGRRAVATFAGVLVQIGLLDLVFSLDSVITAVGMADHLGVMIAAVVIAVGVMMISADPVAAFVSRHPTVKMLALSFLLLIGMTLVAEGAGFHIPKGYIYFAMGFSLLVEGLNLKAGRGRPVTLREPRMPGQSGAGEGAGARG